MGCIAFLSSGPFLLFQSAIFSITTMTLPQLLQRRICQDLFNSTVCKSLSTRRYLAQENIVQEHAASWLTILPTTSLILVSFTILFVGPLADMMGKRKTMFIPPILTLLQAFGFIIIAKFGRKFNPAWLFIPLLITGIFGDSQASLLLALAYRADTTGMQQRTRGISTIEGFFYISVAIFSLIAALFLYYFGFSAAFGLSVLFSVLSLCYVAFVLPDESTSNSEEHGYLLERTSPIPESSEHSEIDELRPPARPNFGGLLKLEKIREVFKHNVHGFNVTVYLLLLFLAVVPLLGLAYLGVLYASHVPYGLVSNSLGYLVATVYTAQAFGAWFVIPLLQRCTKNSDFLLLTIGFAAMVVYFLLMGSAPNVIMLFLTQALMLLTIMPLPVSRSLISKSVPNELHASSLALAELADAAACLVTNFGGNLIYKQTVRYYQGIVMYVYSGVSICGLIIAVYLLRHARVTPIEEQEQKN